MPGSAHSDIAERVKSLEYQAKIPSFDEANKVVSVYVRKPPAECKTPVTAVLWVAEDDNDMKPDWKKVVRKCQNRDISKCLKGNPVYGY